MNIAVSRAVGILRIVASRDEIRQDEILSNSFPDGSRRQS